MIELWIRQAFEQILKTWADGADLRVQFENSEFTPLDGEFYLRATLLMAPAVESDLVEEEQHFGVFQIDVFGPARSGTGQHYAMVESLRTLFPLDLIISDAQNKVMQRSPLRTGPGIQETDKYMVPTSFEFVTFV
jgi:hypothetical protein